MKWMGGWSRSDYDEASPEMITEIINLINEEAERMENR